MTALTDALATVTALCGCPQHPGRTITDPARHAAWHALVLEQGGPAGPCTADALQQQRGHTPARPRPRNRLARVAAPGGPRR